MFEIRIYENHNRIKGDLKVEMSNEGGEIEIFRDVGLHPVFFGKTLVGPLYAQSHLDARIQRDGRAGCELEAF